MSKIKKSKKVTVFKDIEDITELKDLYKKYKEIKQAIFLNPDSDNEINFKKLQLLKKKKDLYVLSQDYLDEIDKRNFKSYPDYNNPNFSQEISKKTEFYYNKTNFNMNTNPCSKEFELGEQQIFLKNFINNRTPYKGLILYHGVGTGKTCSAITLSENFRDMYERENKKIIILTPTDNVQKGWRRNIYDENKGLEQCTGDIYTNIFNEDKKTFNVERNVESKIKKTINKYYEFYGYGEFAGKINKKISIRVSNYPMSERKKMTKIIEKEIIKEYFSNRLLIIDEFHNLRSNYEEEDVDINKRSLKYLKKIVKYADNLRLILLSATPMYNKSEEIIWFLNILLKNDNRPEININDIFQEGKNDGDFKDGINEKLLEKKTRGYISYLRGENPASFPIRLHPDDNDDPLCIDPKKDLDKYPKKNIFGNRIRDSEGGDSEGGDSEDVDGDENINFLKLYKSVFQGKQYEKYEDFSDRYIQDNITLPVISQFKQISNIVYPEGNLKAFDKNFQKKDGKYSYINPSLPFLDESNVADYSIKIHNIIKSLKGDNGSEGIIFIFSEYIWYGLVPLALALEHAGLRRYGDNDLLNYKGKNELLHVGKDGKLIEKSKRKKGEKFVQARYVLLTGDKSLSPNNDAEIDALRSDKNKNGEVVKIILGSDKTAEGLDFKRVREVHVLEPWFHLNKMDQVVGRAIRFCSHEDLDKEKRNVTVYLHTGFLEHSDKDEDKDTVDIYIYKNAEKKAKEIGKIESIFKNNAIDCYLNKDINFIKKFDVNNIELHTSRNKKLVMKPYDKDDTKICSYKKCEIICNIDEKQISQENLDNSTINYDLLEDLIKKIIKFIKELYLDNNLGVFKIKDIEDLLEEYIKKYDRNLIYIALQNMIDEKIVIFNKDYEKGFIISKDEYYIFQPFLEFSDNIPLYYRNINIELNQTENPEYKSIKDLIPEKVIDLKPKPDKVDIFKTITANYNSEFKTFQYFISDIDSESIISKDQPYYANLLFLVIDLLQPDIKSKLYQDLIINYDTYIKNEDEDNFYKSIYGYLGRNFIYDDKKILQENSKKKPIGYFVFNDKKFSIRGSKHDCKDKDSFLFYTINDENEFILVKQTQGFIKQIKSNKIFDKYHPTKRLEGLMAYRIFRTHKQDYRLKIYTQHEEHGLPGKDANGDFDKTDFNKCITDLNISEHMPYDKSKLIKLAKELKIKLGKDVKTNDLKGIAEQIVNASHDNKYLDYDSLDNKFEQGKKSSKPMRSKYLELIFREKDLFLNKDLYCLLFIED